MNIDKEQIAKAEKNADPRVELAVERTALALERTHLAWIRTMLTVMTAGIAIDKGIEFIHQQRLLNNVAIAKNAHMIGILITSTGVLCMLTETIQFVKRSKELAALKNAKHIFFTTNLALAILVMLIGLTLIYLMIETG